MTTAKQVREYAKKHDLYAVWNAEWEEWTINAKPRHKEADYFTSDNQDALNQLEYLASTKE